jgi:hypothetical protein
MSGEQEGASVPKDSKGSWSSFLKVKYTTLATRL